MHYKTTDTGIEKIPTSNIHKQSILDPHSKFTRANADYVYEGKFIYTNLNDYDEGHSRNSLYRFVKQHLGFVPSEEQSLSYFKKGLIINEKDTKIS